GGGKMELAPEPPRRAAGGRLCRPLLLSPRPATDASLPLCRRHRADRAPPDDAAARDAAPALQRARRAAVPGRLLDDLEPGREAFDECALGVLPGVAGAVRALPGGPGAAGPPRTPVDHDGPGDGRR